MPTETAWVLTVAGVAWLLVASVVAWSARDGSRVVVHIARAPAWLYARVFHGLRLRGRRHMRAAQRERPLILVANHTAGIDPVLVQSCCPFFIRWMMASDMQLEWADWAWGITEVISVERDRPDPNAARAAFRALKAGDVVGLFPEGGIERPRRQLLPFMPGVGMLVRRTGATVLPVVIDGTPNTPTAWGSLARPSRSSIRFLEPVRYSEDMSAESITLDLRRRFLDATGWPTNDNPDRALTRA